MFSLNSNKNKGLHSSDNKGQKSVYTYKLLIYKEKLSDNIGIYKYIPSGVYALGIFNARKFFPPGQTGRDWNRSTP